MLGASDFALADGPFDGAGFDPVGEFPTGSTGMSNAGRARAGIGDAELVQSHYLSNFEYRCSPKGRVDRIGFFVSPVLNAGVSATTGRA